MRKNQLVILAVVTALFAAAAGYLLYERQARVITAVAAGERLFPGLIDEVNRVATVEIRNSDGTFTAIRRDGGEWVIEEKHGYPAKVAKIRELILALANARILDKRTSNAELYAQLQVEPIDSEDAKSGQVILKAENGEQMAGLVIGKRRLRGRFGAGTDELYVRKIDAEQSWVADDIPSVLGGLNQWLDRDLVNVARARVRRVTNSRPEGDQLVLRRPSPDASDVAVEDLPKNAKLDQFRANDVASALEWLILDNVKPADDLAASTIEGYSRYETFDGLIIDVTVRTAGKPGTKDGEPEADRWIVLDAGFNPEGVSEAAPAEPAPATEFPQETAKDDGGLKAPEAVGENAAKLAERFKGWAYKVPDWKIEVFLRRQADLIDKENSGS
ncbi:MAG: DUF4340 domain-containing protein [Acetobacterales bacterium]